MDTIYIEIQGVPIAKKRPKFARRGKFVTTYNQQETEEGRFILDVRQQFKGVLIEGPISLRTEFHMPIPKGTSQKKIELMLLNTICHTKKPDVDNLVKFTKDCLNGEVWKDDSQVVSLRANKFYSSQPKTRIWIEEIK
jgi:Holliday junction resolvase RusA-like endonuclease